MKSLTNIIAVKSIIQFTVSDFFRCDLLVDLFYDPVGKKIPRG